MKWITFVALATIAFGPALAEGARPPDAQTVSLLGKPLFPPPLASDVRQDREAKLEEARAAYDENPRDLEALIWLGRRTAYLGQYREALAIFSEGLRIHPDEPRLYRHRGHRWITLRRFDEAIRDLERAVKLIEGKEDRVEQDGLPNERNQPTSTLQSNIWYHLGLAYFLKADFENARRCFASCLAVSKNPDMLSATSNWLYMSQRRLGRTEQALRTLEPIDAEMEIIENHAYHRLLLMYQGALTFDALLLESLSGDGSIESATLAFGLANWSLVEGDSERAVALMREIVASPQWAAFGAIAAEADLARLEP
jgi:tetratricopeptide (TPR) repeat protein